MSANDTDAFHDLCPALNACLVVFPTIAIYNAIELNLIIWSTFKRYSGCYFWSFLVATNGIPILATGLFLKAKVTSQGSSYVTNLVSSTGWIMTVTGQSMVLWSRLHLILRSRFRLRLILAMIIVDAIIGHFPPTVLTYGSIIYGIGPWTAGFDTYQDIQVSLFFVQECIISGVYVWETLKLMRQDSLSSLRRGSRRLMRHLICVNVVVILLDVTILGLQYSQYTNLQTAYKCFAYSVKLKLEYTILNKMVEITRPANRDSQQRLRGRDRDVSDKAAADAFSIYGSRPGPDCAYEANARSEGCPGWAEPAGRNRSRGRSVMLTTEIRVQTEDRDSPPDNLDSKERSSGRWIAMSSDVGTSRTSRASSERQLDLSAAGRSLP